MAVEKSKIKERLKVLYPGVNLSKERIEQISSRLATKPADDAEEAAIDEVITNANDFMPFADIAKEDDRVRTLLANQKPTPSPAPAPEPNPEPAPKPTPTDDTPAWVKTLMEDVKALKAEKAQTTIKEKAKTALKDVPEVFWKRAPLPENEADLETWAEEIKTDYTALKQSEVNNTLGTGATAKGASNLSNKEAPKEKIGAMLKNMIPNS
ncbi:hypothetical protein [Adhaeribacter aquaticus]|uniref:hypothetical protein n=1 Tax=Adhaeribacter aquaticus TaxID=299567 RepID=UPI0004091920|nr:hypothetical protein [Adhaeribacter aquaticus]